MPAETPVINPDDEFIVATPVVEEVQVPPATDDKNVVVDPVQIAWFPLNDPAFGGAVTVTVLVPEVLKQPPVPATV